MISQYMAEIDKYDSEMAARGYTSGDIAEAKSALLTFRARSLQSVVTNVGTVAPIFGTDSASECARVLLLYALGASDHFAEPTD